MHGTIITQDEMNPTEYPLNRTQKQKLILENSTFDEIPTTPDWNFPNAQKKSNLSKSKKAPSISQNQNLIKSFVDNLIYTLFRVWVINPFVFMITTCLKYLFLWFLYWCISISRTRETPHDFNFFNYICTLTFLLTIFLFFFLLK